MKSRMTLVCLGALLLLASANAEQSLYRLSPKIPSHNRYSPPIASPFLTSPAMQRIPLTPEPDTGERSFPTVSSSAPSTHASTHASPPPDWEEGMQPVSDTHSIVAPQPLPNMDASSSMPANLHPVSFTPQTPAGTSAPTASKPTARIPVAEAAPSNAHPSVTHAKKASTAKFSAGRGKNKPIVHFPEPLNAQAGAKNAEEDDATGNLYLAISPLNGTDEATIHYNRGGFYTEKNQLESAFQEYQRAIELNPSFPDAYVGLSSVSILSHHWEAALSSANQALRMRLPLRDPVNLGQAHYNLSTAYCAIDQYRNAKRHYKQAILTGHPQTQELWSYLNQTCKR